jgi:ferric-dicitrate binding protein FerR (iron transport regulator)
MTMYGNSDSGDEQFTRDLLESAGRREPVPESELAAITNAARAEWRKRYAAAESKVRPRRWLVPLAAALLGGIILSWWSLGPRPVPPRPPIAGHVDRISGMVSATPANGDPVRLMPGQSIVVGSVVATRGGPAESRVALRLAGGQSLRLDAGSTVSLVSPTLVQLMRGAVYLDSRPASSTEPVTIRTASGDFHPIGTQFEVRLDASGGTLLRVREGSVRVTRPSESVTATAGEELILRGDGTMVRGSRKPDDEGWGWVLEAVPMLEIEGRTLRTFLDWVARENGWKLQFGTDQAASLSDTIILHGSIHDLDPTEALRTVTLSSAFSYRVVDATLIVDH